MNIKVIFNQKVHKLPKECSKSLENVIKALHLVYKQKLPKFFEIQTLETHTPIKSDQDLKQQIQNCQNNKKPSLKIEIKESSQSQENQIMMTSQLKNQAEQDKNILFDNQSLNNSQIFQYKGSIFDDSIMVEPQQNNNNNEKKFTCYQCNGSVLNTCNLCNNQGFISENNPLVKLISEIVDHRVKIALDKQNEDNFFEIHDRFTCDECSSNPIIGTRYHCSVCKDFDLCQNCEKVSKHPHNFIKVKLADPIIQKQEPQLQQQQKPNLIDQIKQTFFKPVQEQQQQQQKPKQEPEQQQQQNLSNSQLSKQFKAKFDSSPVSQIFTNSPNEVYKWNVVLKNHGQVKWPESVRFYCIQGPYFGISEKVIAVNPNESFQIDLNLNSIQEGKQMVSWRLGYKDQNQEIQYFGPKVTYELVVKKEKQEQNEKQEISCSEASPEILSQNKIVLEKAQKLQEIFGGRVKVYQDFITNAGLQNYSLEEIQNLYIEQAEN